MKISIVTVTFNAAGTIGDTIRSVTAQDWPDYEHLIIDGLSKDDTATVVDRLGHDRLRFVSEPDEGCYDAMNKGLRLATGDVVVFLNADDLLARPDALRLAGEAFASTGADCVGGQTAIVDQHDIRKVRRLYRSEGFRPWMLRFGHMPPHPSFYARRDVLLRAGGFDTRYRIAGDFDLMSRLFVPGIRFAAIPHTLSAFREGGLSTSGWDAKVTINREIRAILQDRGMKAGAAQLWARYPLKVLQLLRRPCDYPARLEELGLADAPCRPTNMEAMADARARY